MQKPYKHGKYTIIPGILTSQLELNQATTPRQSGKYKGCSIGRDRNGLFVFTHRARSDSYPTLKAIPLKTVKWISSTG
jgi:hypothetical protein